jgi:quinol monooxygenase YgiN
MAGVRLILQFTAGSKEEADGAIAAMADRCRKAQQEEGCIQFEVFRSELQPEKYALLEHWSSPEALDEHRKRGTGGTNPAIKRVREDYEYKEG